MVVDRVCVWGEILSQDAHEGNLELWLKQSQPFNKDERHANVGRRCSAEKRVMLTGTTNKCPHFVTTIWVIQTALFEQAYHTDRC